MEAGDQDIMLKKDGEGNDDRDKEEEVMNTNHLELIETDRLVNEINTLKKKIKDSVNINSNTKQFQQEFQIKLEILL